MLKIEIVILSGGGAFAAVVEGPAFLFRVQISGLILALPNISRRIRHIHSLTNLHGAKH